VGAGISRLRHVVMLVPDMVKIDSALTAGIEHDPTRHAVVAAMADCAAQLGAVAVAAGVAGVEQVEALQAVGVTLGQSALSLEAGTLTSMDPARALNIRGRRADASNSTTTAVQPGEGTR
jgi:EAL domain-containing protein (putative c-di-GMP-specific phosphodiesterase class I)